MNKNPSLFLFLKIEIKPERVWKVDGFLGCIDDDGQGEWVGLQPELGEQRQVLLRINPVHPGIQSYYIVPDYMEN